MTQPTPGYFGIALVDKKILHGASLYFNPGELVGIMRPLGDYYMTKPVFII